MRPVGRVHAPAPGGAGEPSRGCRPAMGVAGGGREATRGLRLAACGRWPAGRVCRPSAGGWRLAGRGRRLAAGGAGPASGGRGLGRLTRGGRCADLSWIFRLPRAVRLGKMACRCRSQLARGTISSPACHDRGRDHCPPGGIKGGMPVSPSRTWGVWTAGVFDIRRSMSPWGDQGGSRRKRPELRLPPQSPRGGSKGGGSDGAPGSRRRRRAGKPSQGSPSAAGRVGKFGLAGGRR